MPRTSNKAPKDSTAWRRFEDERWLVADRLRDNMEAAEYRSGVLGLNLLGNLPYSIESQWAKPHLIECNNPRQAGVSTVAKPRTFVNAAVAPLHSDLQAHWEGLAGKDTPEEYAIPSLVGLERGGKQGLSHPSHPLQRNTGVDRREVTNPAGRTFANRSLHTLRHSLESDQADCRSNQGIGRKRTGHKTAWPHSLYTHSERDTLRATVHGIPTLPEV